MRRLTFLVACVCAAQSQPVPLTSGSAITGAVTGEGGAAVAGGDVTLERMPPYPKGRMWTKQSSSRSAADGSFRFDGLHAGNYRLCVQAPATTWLNPCEWGRQAPIVAVSDTQPSAKITIVLKRGVVVPIRLDDPAQLVAQNEGKTPGAHLLIGVGNDAFFFRPAAVMSQDSGGRNYSVVIPFDTLVKLVVSSSFFRLSDAVGVPLARTGAAAIPVTVPAGQPAATVRLIVAGGGK